MLFWVMIEQKLMPTAKKKHTHTQKANSQYYIYHSKNVV